MKDRHISRGFTLVEALVSLLLLSIIIIAFLSMLNTFSGVAKIQGNIADTNENMRYSMAALIRLVRMAGTGGMPIVYRPTAANLMPLAVDIVDNAAAGNTFTSSISGQSWGITASRPVVAGTDVLRIRGVMTTPIYDVVGANFSGSTLTVPNVSPWTSLAQTLVPMPAGTGRALLVSLQNPMDITPSIGGVRRYGLYRVVEVKNNPTVSGSSMAIQFDDTAGEAYKTDNPGGTPTITPSQSYAAGFVDDFIFYVARNSFNEPSLYRLRVNTAGGAVTAEELVPDVSNLQLAAGCDININQAIEPAEWYFSDVTTGAPSVDQFAGLRELRLSVVSRTGDRDQSWTSKAKIPENGAALSGQALQYRYRIVTVRIGLRSHPQLTQN